jgi:hypothetical protein
VINEQVAEMKERRMKKDLLFHPNFSGIYGMLMKA